MGFAVTVYIALFGWPLAMLALAFFFPVRWVVLISVIGANLFLPIAAIGVAGMPDYNRGIAGGLGALLAASLFAAPQLFSWRPVPLDIFFFAFLVSSGISSVVNGLGAWDAMSVTVNNVLDWGVAYWVGRALFRDQQAIRELALGIVAGGLVYAPLCIWEVVMSPQLNRQIYGFQAAPFIMSRRWGGFRPTVFMPHGLAVAVWMACSALVAWVLWRSKSIVKIRSVPMSWIAIGLVVVTIGLRSTGAAILLIGMIGALEFVQFSRMRIFLLALLLLPAGYIGLRVAGWNGDLIVRAVSVLGPDRVGSLTMRLENDALIVSRAMQQPIFGWGGWGRWRVRDEFGNDITISDSWWGIILGTRGLFGLIGTYGTFIAPMFLLIRRRARGRIFEPVNGAAWAIGMALLLFVLDSMANAMPNASFMLAAGALVSFFRVPVRRLRPVAAGSPWPASNAGQDQQHNPPPTPEPVRHRPIDLR